MRQALYGTNLVQNVNTAPGSGVGSGNIIDLSDGTTILGSQDFAPWISDQGDNFIKFMVGNSSDYTMILVM